MPDEDRAGHQSMPKTEPYLPTFDTGATTKPNRRSSNRNRRPGGADGGVDGRTPSTEAQDEPAGEPRPGS